VNILERSSLLASGSLAKKYYGRLRWLGKKKSCSQCGGQVLFTLSDGRYKCKGCGVRFSDYAGTYLAGIKVGFQAAAWLVQLFVLELSAHRASKELGMSYRTVYRFFDRIRRAIASDDCKNWLSGEVELDETYVGGKRKGKRGRGAAGVVQDVSEGSLMSLVKKTVEPGSLTYSDGFSSYRSLIINGYEHIRIDHEKEFANGKAHINGIESFWAYAKERLAKYHGVSPLRLYLYLKELEFRFNNREAVDLFELINMQLVKSVRSRA
jgi:transposase